MSINAKPYNFPLLDGEEKDSIKHINAIVRHYIENFWDGSAAGPLLIKGPCNQESAQEMVKSFRENHSRISDFDYKFVSISHNKLNEDLVLSFYSTHNLLSQVLTVDPDDYDTADDEAKILHFAGKTGA